METTARWNLPMIEPGQAQKELFHNEALALIDAGMQACVVAAGVDAPPLDPAPGQCWIVGSTPSGAWAGQASTLACRTAGGWRFIPPREGLAVWHEGQRVVWRYGNGGWEAGIVRASRVMIGGTPVTGPQEAAIPAPANGAVIDAEARATIGTILAAMRNHGLIAS